MFLVRIMLIHLFQLLCGLLIFKYCPDDLQYIFEIGWVGMYNHKCSNILNVSMKVIFMPNVTRLIQSMDQNAIGMTKKKSTYIRFIKKISKHSQSLE